MWLRRGDIWSPSPVTLIISHGRAVTLAMLCEAASRNAVQAPNPIAHQRRGRGRCLGSFLYAHPSCPTLEPISVGMGRAKSRNSGPCPYPEPLLCVPNTLPKCLCPHRDIPNPHLDLTLHLQKLPLDCHHWSPLPLQNHLSWAMKLTQIKSTPVYSITF